MILVIKGVIVFFVLLFILLSSRYLFRVFNDFYLILIVSGAWGI